MPLRMGTRAFVSLSLAAVISGGAMGSVAFASEGVVAGAEPQGVAAGVSLRDAAMTADADQLGQLPLTPEEGIEVIEGSLAGVQLSGDDVASDDLANPSDAEGAEATVVDPEAGEQNSAGQIDADSPASAGDASDDAEDSVGQTGSAAGDAEQTGSDEANSAESEAPAGTTGPDGEAGAGSSAGDSVTGDDQSSSDSDVTDTPAAGATTDASQAPSLEGALGWAERDGETYYLGADGNPLTGLVRVDGAWYYLDPAAGGARATGEVELPNGTYHFDEATGAMVEAGGPATGEAGVTSKGDSASADKDKDTSASADADKAAKKTGLVLDEATGKYYYYGADGQKLTGEQAIDGGWYYFDKDTGAMVTGFADITTTGGVTKTVYYDDKGRMYYGELASNNAWYYFDRFNGTMARGITDIITNGGLSKTAYYANGGAHDGQMQYGEQAVDGYWYYFDDFNGAMATGITDIPTSNGGSKTVYYGDDGRMGYGEQNVDGGWYYFDTFNGAMATGITDITTNGGAHKTVYYGPDGRMRYGEQAPDGYWHYFDDFDGHMVIGWKWIDSGNKMVYYGSDGRMFYGTHVIDGYQRIFNDVTGAVDKYGFQNPLGYYQVSTNNVWVPNYSGNPAFSYTTPSQIGLAADRWDCIETFINTAYSYLGTPYVWDYALAPGLGIDCAGLVMQALYSTGMDLGSGYTPYDHYFTPGHDHYANDMAADDGFMTVAFSDRQRGDLIFYPGHVAIYLGDDMVIDSYPGDGADGVAVRSMWHYGVNYIVKRPFV